MLGKNSPDNAVPPWYKHAKVNENKNMRIPWKTIASIRDNEVPRNGLLGALDALHDVWKKRIVDMSEEERLEIKKRSQRRLAVETGILERLYDVDWGLTLTLVAEGFGRDVVERAGGNVDDRTLATLRAQMDSIGLVLDFVQEDRPLSSSFIKALHQSITKTQNTYIATDSLGRIVETELPKGEWKKQPNHVQRADGTILEYAPPEHVASEVDRLVSMWKKLETGSAHAIVKAAWLHHRFVQIHPFSDGNGRVARALTLLVLEKHRFPPLVIDRWHRKEYLNALETANNGDLPPLIRLFAKLESSAIVSEIERPEKIAQSGLSNDVAHSLADQLLAIKRRETADIKRKLDARSIAVAGHIETWFGQKESSLKDMFESKGVEIEVFADTGKTPDDRCQWFRRQVVDSARKAGHFANFSGFLFWSRLKFQIDSLQISYVASLHGAGREPGVMAVTTFGEIRLPSNEPADEPDRSATRIAFDTTLDALTFVFSESEEDIAARGPDLNEMLDEGLATALARAMKEV